MTKYKQTRNETAIHKMRQGKEEDIHINEEWTWKVEQKCVQCVNKNLSRLKVSTWVTVRAMDRVLTGFWFCFEPEVNGRPTIRIGSKPLCIQSAFDGVLFGRPVCLHVFGGYHAIKMKSVIIEKLKKKKKDDLFAFEQSHRSSKRSAGSTFAHFRWFFLLVFLFRFFVEHVGRTVAAEQREFGCVTGSRSRCRTFRLKRRDRLSMQVQQFAARNVERVRQSHAAESIWRFHFAYVNTFRISLAESEKIVKKKRLKTWRSREMRARNRQRSKASNLICQSVHDDVIRHDRQWVNFSHQNGSRNFVKFDAFEKSLHDLTRTK